jgi:CRP/FNR family transcriptional regulator, cyclic AMP receptor protein
VTGVSPQVLGAHPFLRGMPAGHVALLAGTAVAVSVSAGFRFFEEGGRAARLWLISSGRVALDLDVPGRTRLIVETVGSGDVIGLSWLFPAGQWQFGAEAIQDTAAFELDGAAVRALGDRDPDLGSQITGRMMAVAASRLQATRIRLLDLYAAPGRRAGAR